MPKHLGRSNKNILNFATYNAQSVEYLIIARSLRIMRKNEIDQIKSASLQDSLAMLEEVAQYLKSLPPVPATYHLIKKVESFVDSPETKTAIRISEEHSCETELRKNSRVAGEYTLVGLPLIEVEVKGDFVRLKMPHHHTWRAVVSRLKQGLMLKLSTAK